MNFGAYLETTEYWTGASFTFGPDLPKAMMGHCIGKVNETHGILVGGEW